MSTENFNHEDQDFNKVVEMLSPRFQRKSEIKFKTPRKNFPKIIWTISGVAAMLAIVFTISFQSIFTVSASDVINTALDNLYSAKNIKVEFEILGSKTTQDEIYKPNIDGEPIRGTLFIINDNGKIFNRVDWHDNENNSIIYNGTDYIHLKNGAIVGKHPSLFSKELLQLLNLDHLNNNMLKEADIKTHDNNIEVKLKNLKSDKYHIIYSGEFLRTNKQLVKASAVLMRSDNQVDTLFKTISIETNIDIPQNIIKI